MVHTRLIMLIKYVRLSFNEFACLSLVGQYDSETVLGTQTYTHT